MTEISQLRISAAMCGSRNRAFSSKSGGGSRVIRLINSESTSVFTRLQRNIQLPTLQKSDAQTQAKAFVLTLAKYSGQANSPQFSDLMDLGCQNLIFERF